MQEVNLTVTIKTQTESERETDALESAYLIQQAISEHNPDGVFIPNARQICAIILGRPEPEPKPRKKCHEPTPFCRCRA